MNVDLAYRKLWCAVIEDARRQQRHGEARNFFKSNHFGILCGHLGLPAEEIRRVITGSKQPDGTGRYCRR